MKSNNIKICFGGKNHTIFSDTLESFVNDFLEKRIINRYEPRRANISNKSVSYLKNRHKNQVKYFGNRRYIAMRSASVKYPTIIGLPCEYSHINLDEDIK